MAKVLPLLFAAAAAVILLGKKSSGNSVLSPPPKVPSKVSGGTTPSKEIWQQRQAALAYLDGLGLCNCNPGTQDGVAGKSTSDAILGFQSWINIGLTGEWDELTDAKMDEIMSSISATWKKGT